MENLVSKNKFLDVCERLQHLGIHDHDLREEFIKGSGRGGQKINKTSSCVQLTCLKNGWVVRCQMSRSREQNRFLARRILLERLTKAVLGKESDEEKMRRKIRLQKKRRLRRTKEKILAQKKHRSALKRLRHRPEI